MLTSSVCGAVSVIFGKIAKGRQSAVMERVNKRISKWYFYDLLISS